MCIEAMLGISLYSYPHLKLAKMLCFHIIAYVFLSTKLKKRVEQVLAGRDRGWGKKGAGRGGGRGEGGRNGPNNVCTYE
jgi:hypothetical protein